jgi:hypothetical protein
MRRLGGIVALVAALALTGCASAKTYDTPDELVDAFVTAGGACKNPQEVMEAMIGEGAHATLCPDDGVNMLIVFDSEEQTNRYVADVATDGTTLVKGARWVVVSDDAGTLAGSLGGEVVGD